MEAKRTQGGHMRTKCGRGQSGMKADSGGHMADKLRGRSKREPHSKLLGKIDCVPETQSDRNSECSRSQ